MKFNSIKFKVGNLFTIILGVILALYSVFLQLTLSKYLIDDLQQELAGKMHELENIIADELTAAKYDDVDKVVQRIFSFQYPPKSSVIAVKKKKSVGKPLSDEEKWFVRFDRLDLSQDLVAFFEPDGQLIFRPTSIPADDFNKFISGVDISLQEDTFSKVIINKVPYRQIQATIVLPNGRHLFVLVAASEKPILDLLRHRQKLFMISIPIILLMTAFLGRLLANRILRPVHSIVLTARQITSRDLSKRLEKKEIDEEMEVLVDSLNDMIARLESSFNHIEQFSSQVAHELKTPLAILRGETEVALRTNKSAADYKAVLKENLDEIEKIIRIVEDLLLLAKLDYRPQFFKFDRFDFKEFFVPIIDKTKLLAEERNIEILCIMPQEPVTLNGDPVHLRRLFLNIIYNAIKFTPPGGRVSMVVKAERSRLKVSIADEGPGISEEYIPQLFTRFFQIPNREEDSQKGSGLGLSIAQSVAKAHQGIIEVQSCLHKGSVFTVSLPLS